MPIKNRCLLHNLNTFDYLLVRYLKGPGIDCAVVGTGEDAVLRQEIAPGQEGKRELGACGYH